MRHDRTVPTINSWGLGLPAGSAAAVEAAYEELAAQQVLLIVGPAIGDNALIATPLTEQHRMPTLNWAGAERARSEYMFHLQVGSHEDESVVIAHHLAALDVSNVGVIYDRSPIGERHLEFLQSEAQILGLRVVAAHGVSPLAQSAHDEVDAVLAANPDAFVYLGLGLSTPPVALALKAKGFNIRRLVAEALARAPEASCEGVKAGLELIKWLPAAEGHEGTLLGFGKYDRGALHGRYLVMRQGLMVCLSKPLRCHNDE